MPLRRRLKLAETDTVRHAHIALATIDGRRLIGALFVAPEPVAVARSFAFESLTRVFKAPSERLRVLAGRPGRAAEDQGAMICSCFQLGVNAIASAILSGDCASAAEIGAMLGAGRNCDSCGSEIKRIIEIHVRPDPLGTRSRRWKCLEEVPLGGAPELCALSWSQI